MVRTSNSRNGDSQSKAFETWHTFTTKSEELAIQIEEGVKNSGLSKSKFLEQCISAYLDKDGVQKKPISENGRNNIDMILSSIEDIRDRINEISDKLNKDNANSVISNEIAQRVANVIEYNGQLIDRRRGGEIVPVDLKARLRWISGIDNRISLLEDLRNEEHSGAEEGVKHWLIKRAEGRNYYRVNREANVYDILVAIRSAIRKKNDE